MTVWLTIPCKKPVAEANAVLNLWRAKGYKIAVFRDLGDHPVNADIHIYGQYPGYGKATNAICKAVAAIDYDMEFCVAGGDDVHPADGDPAVIAREIFLHFGGTFGVMECTGDRWMEDRQGRCAAERVCIAPWLGRDWITRAYEGDGPLCGGYQHFFVDEELACVAETLGALWRRPDLTQYHDHWTRRKTRRPEYLDEAKLNWADAKAYFEARRKTNFPGSEPLPSCKASTVQT